MPTKYIYLEVIQGYFSSYWEDVSEYENDHKGMRHDLREYRLSSPHPYRVIQRRQLR